MKTYVLFALLFFMVCCSQNDAPKPPSVKQSIEALLGVSATPKIDTTQLKTVLANAYVLAEQLSDRQHDTLIASVSALMADTLIKSKKLLNARFYAHNGLKFGHKWIAFNDLKISKLYYSITLSYYYEEDFKQALTYSDSVKPQVNDKACWVLKTKNQLIVAECYQKLKDTKTAESIYQNVKPMVDVYLSDREKLNYYMRYAALKLGDKKFGQAIEAAQKSIDIIANLAKHQALKKEDTSFLANAYFYIASALDDSTAYKSAEIYYIKALDIYKKQGNMDAYRRGLLNLGLMYRYDKRFDKALKVLTEGITQLDVLEQSDNNILRKAKLFNNRAEVFMDLKHYYKALADHDSAIAYLTRYDYRQSLTTLLLANQKSLIWAYSDNARAYAALADKGLDTEGYAKSLKMTEKVMEIADNIRADYFSDDAKLTLANDIKPALEKAIALCQNLYKTTKNAEYRQKAFGFVEYSRSMVLYENARLANQLPSELKAENDRLKAEASELPTKNNIEALQKYLQHKRQFREKIKALNKNQLANISDLQRQLLPNAQTAFIEYFVGDSSIFTFVLLKNDLKLFEIKKNKDFEQQIEAFRKGITLDNPVRDATTFGKQSADLYDILLRGPLSDLPPTISKLSIAPDGVLAYLPFEILIKNDERVKNTSVKSNDGRVLNPSVAADFRKYDFLLKHFTISYAYSANLLLMQKQTKQHDANKIFGGFAPKYLEKDTELVVSSSHVPYDAIASRAVLTREGAYELKGAQEEVQAITELFGGKSFVNEFATEGSFKREANQYRILHLAMHASADNNDPMLSKLLFTLNLKDNTQDGDLTAAELYAMNLNADLAVLSACNTGFGTLSKGEGVMSLARAFTYAGVPATVTSLWKVPDLTTRDIMEAFYKNLKKGMDKDTALREAKLAYLKTAPESIAANPYFWAGFVPTGNMDAMDLTEKRPLSIKWILAGLSVFIIGIMVFIRKKMGV